MSDLDEFAIKAARDLAEESLARQICLDVLEAARLVEPASRTSIADTKLHARLLEEICNYKDRLMRQIDTLLQRYKQEIK